MSYTEFDLYSEDKENLFGKRLQGPTHSSGELKLFRSKKPKINFATVVIDDEVSQKMTLKQLLESNPDQTIFSRKKVYQIFINSIEYFVSPPYTVRKYTDQTGCDFWYAIISETKMSGATGYVKKVAPMRMLLPFCDQDLDCYLKEKTYKIERAKANHNSIRHAFNVSCTYEDEVLKGLRHTKVEIEKITASEVVQKYRFISLWQKGTSLQDLLTEQPFFLGGDVNSLYFLFLSITKILTEINVIGVHLDIKPGNILIHKKKASHIIDGDTYVKFVACFPKLIRTTGVYSAPELKRNGYVNKDVISFKKFDSFALGMTFLVVLGFDETELNKVKIEAIKKWKDISFEESLCNVSVIKNKILECFPINTTEEIADFLSQIIAKLVTIRPEKRFITENAFLALQNIGAMFACEGNLAYVK